MHSGIRVGVDEVRRVIVDQLNLDEVICGEVIGSIAFDIFRRQIVKSPDVDFLGSGVGVCCDRIVDDLASLYALRLLSNPLLSHRVSGRLS